ncbi:polyprotein [Phytophthora megakarya]|uniref:Polyprotein n=1 Tax=Phytophthora megakarya TaxID=4795 RepID=A0A225VI71_9STRA|nr:polyprotein [Phytophthora megakarya]
MTNHIKTTKRVIRDFQEQRVLLSDDEKRQNFMQSLGPSFNGFVGVLEMCQTFEAMVTRCQAEAIRRDQQKNRRSTNSGSKSNASFSAEQAAGTKGGKKKHDMTEAKCYNSQEMGHFARDCTKERVLPKSKGGETASVAFSVDDATEDCRRGWIMDSGATGYMTGHVDNLTGVRELSEPRVLTVASGDYTEKFSPVVHHSTLRLVLVIGVARRMKRMQLDVKTAFLNSDWTRKPIWNRLNVTRVLMDTCDVYSMHCMD